MPHSSPYGPGADEATRPRRVRAGRTVLIGAGAFAVSLLVALSPLVLGRNGVNKYLVAFAFVGACFGLSCLAHGAWDWVRGR